MKYGFILTLFALSLIACGTTANKNVAGKNETTSSQIKQVVTGCTEIVEIVNYTHEADCQYLFKMEDGTLLFPADLPVKDDVAFYNGAGLKIGYEILKEDNKNVAKVSCTKHDYLVKVTCMEQFVLAEKGLPASHSECKSIKNPYKFAWMRNAINNLKPSLVSEFAYNPGFMYEFKTTSGSYLYDCLGNQVCSTESNPDCKSLLDGLTDPKVILVVNN